MIRPGRPIPGRITSNHKEIHESKSCLLCTPIQGGWTFHFYKESAESIAILQAGAGQTLAGGERGGNQASRTEEAKAEASACRKGERQIISTSHPMKLASGS